MTQEKLLEKARNNYPIGTKFINVMTDKIEIADFPPYFYNKFNYSNNIAVKEYLGVIYNAELDKWSQVIHPNIEMWLI